MTPYNQFICGNDGDALEISNTATSGMYQPADWLYDAFTGGVGKSDAGVTVNGYTALMHCPLWAGVNIIAGDFGQTPVRLIRNEFDEQKKHPAWNLLRVRPNRLQTPGVWKETMMQWTLIWGNGVSLIIRQGSRPVELIPLRPDCLWPELVSFESEQILIYHYHSATTGREYKFFPDDVLHFKGLTSDGVWGYPLWQIAKNTIGFGLALQRHGNTTFANGAVPSGVLEAPPTAVGISKNKEARTNLRNEWNAVHRGPDKAGAIAILWEGITYKQTSTTNIDAQWIEGLNVDVYQAARLLTLPPHKLGALQDSSVRANLEEQNADYVQRSLARRYNNADEEYRRKLLTEKELVSDEYQFKHDADAFMKGDIDTISTVADRLVKAELANRNEGRAMLGMAPYPGGEKYGSPAINPQDGSKAREQNDPNTPQSSPKKATEAVKIARKASLNSRVRSKMSAVLKAESNELLRAAKEEKNFIKWIDTYYGHGDKCGHVITAFDGAMAGGVGFHPPKERIVALRGRFMEWLAERRDSLLYLCSGVTSDGLLDAVGTFQDITCDASLERELCDGLFEESETVKDGTENN